MRKSIDDDAYEILELNVSEPIIFRRDNNQQHTYNEDNNNQVILVVPTENY
jgi:hypothetical protein